MLKTIILVLISLFFSANFSVANADDSILGDFFGGVANELGKQAVREIIEERKRRKQSYQPAPEPVPIPEERQAIREQSRPAPVQQEEDESTLTTIDDNIRQTVHEHFVADSKCQVEQSMQYYYENVNYEKQDIPKEQLRKVKSGYCNRLPDGKYNISNNEINVENIQVGGNIFKKATYYVDYSVYSTAKQKIITGSTGVMLILGGIEPFPIIVERHFNNKASN